MAIFGNFSDIALVDVFRVLRSKTGTLVLSGLPEVGEVTIDLHCNHAVAMTIGGHPVTLRDHAADRIRQLLGHTQGTFTFQAAEGTQRTFLLPLHPVLHQFAQLNASVPDSELPHPETRFTLVAAQPEVPAALHGTWEALAPLLRGATSASEAAPLLGWTVRETQATLYRYRSTGLIELASTAPVVPVPAGAADGDAPATQSVLRRFIHRLRTWGGA